MEVENMKCLKMFLFLLLTSAFLGPVSAQGTWKNYTFTNMISNIAVYHQYVWCGTDGGVICWDTQNNQYTTYTSADGLLENRIYSIAVGPHGDVWCGMSSTGVCHFDGIKWTSYSDPEKLQNPWAIAVGLDGRPWVGTSDKGLFRFNGSEWMQKDTSPNAIVYSIDVAPNGDIWSGFSLNYRTNGDGGVRVYNNDSPLKKYTTAQGLGSNHINSVAVGFHGEVWCGSALGFISRLDGEKWTTFESAEIISEGWPSHIAISPSGEVWITRKNPHSFDGVEGIARYSNGEVNIYTEDDGLADNMANTVEIDASGNVWIGTNNGLSLYDGVKWKTFRSKGNLNFTRINSIAAEQDGSIWCGTYEGGVLLFDNDEWSMVTTEDGLADNAVRAVAIAPNGDVWVGTINGVSRFDGTSWKTYTHEDGLISDKVSCIHIMPDGVVWIGTNGGGVSRFDGKIWTSYNNLNGLCGNYVAVINHAPNGDIWFGTYQDGASRFDGTSWKTFTPADGLPYNTVKAIAVDLQGNVWFGTHDYPPDYYVGKVVPIKDERGVEKPAGMYRGAVTRFDGEHWEVYTLQNGLPADWVEAIDVSPEGDVWFATEGESGYGVSKFDGEKMTIYTMADGLAGNQVRTLHVGPNGKVYFGTELGLSIYTPHERPVIVETKEPFSTNINSLANYPNPFNPLTTIRFYLNQKAMTDLVIYSVSGQKIRTLVSGEMSAGMHSVLWNSRDDHGQPVSSGVYLYRLESGGKAETRKMLLMR
jgi:ligand-binding sensor domain-containing protein